MQVSQDYEQYKGTDLSGSVLSRPGVPGFVYFDDRWPELAIVGGAERLKFPTLEQLRDVYDRGHCGLVFIGMPGIERRLSRYARVSTDEQTLGLQLDALKAAGCERIATDRVSGPAVILPDDADSSRRRREPTRGRQPL